MVSCPYFYAKKFGRMWIEGVLSEKAQPEDLYPEEK
jgi:hypothetical protein